MELNGKELRMGIIVNHQRRRTKALKRKEGFEIDHIIPYCISLDDSKENLQYLKKQEHKKKTIKDKKIIKIFKKKGWITKITNYSHELNKSISFLKKKYLEQQERPEQQEAYYSSIGN